MSRTFKDKKWSLTNPEDDFYFGKVKVVTTAKYFSCIANRWVKRPSVTYLDIPGAKTKKKKSVDFSNNGMGSTPSWWVNTFMTKPKRRACRTWERKVLFSDIEETICPDFGKKPHICYW